jgi:hypothetical protein
LSTETAIVADAAEVENTSVLISRTAASANERILLVTFFILSPFLKEI